MIQLSQTTLGRFVDPQSPANDVLRNVRLNQPEPAPEGQFGYSSA